MHEELTDLQTDQDGKELEYFSKAEPAFRALQKLILDKRWMKSLKFYVNFRSVFVILESCMYNYVYVYFTRHTGMLESFNSLLLAYSLKHAAFQSVLHL